jgi:hypothetical protein|nr:MAG TPA_asm: hypothetical protein [Caudoviricetes sp.]
MRTQMKNVEVPEKEGLSYVAVQSAPREHIDWTEVFHSLSIGIAGASALMAVGAWLAISIMR